MHRLALCVMAATLLSCLAACHAPMPARALMPSVPVVAQAQTVAPARDGFATISVTDLRCIPAAERPRLIDVREPDEFAGGHVGGAVNVPLATVAAWADKQHKDEPLMVICHSGRRSSMACQTLVDKGFTHITNIAGGTAAWIQAGYPVVTGSRR